MAVELEFEGRFNGQEFRQSDSGPVPWHTAATGLGSCHFGCCHELVRAWLGRGGQGCDHQVLSWVLRVSPSIVYLDVPGRVQQVP